MDHYFVRTFSAEYRIIVMDTTNVLDAKLLWFLHSLGPILQKLLLFLATYHNVKFLMLLRKKWEISKLCFPIISDQITTNLEDLFLQNLVIVPKRLFGTLKFLCRSPMGGHGCPEAEDALFPMIDCFAMISLGCFDRKQTKRLLFGCRNLERNV